MPASPVRTDVSEGQPRGRLRFHVLAVLAALALVAAACGDAGGDTTTTTTTTTTTLTPPAEDTTTTAPAIEPVVTIVATTTILGDVAANVVGPHGLVEVLMPVGADPHDFSPSSRQVARMHEADLVIANGLLLEEGLTDVLEALEGEGVLVLWLAQLLDPIPVADPDDGHDHDNGHDDDNGHDHGEYDPHVWMDPIRMATGAMLIAEALDAIAPQVDWTSRAAAYADELAAVDAEITALVSTLPAERRLLVTNHHSLGYFAHRYGFTVVGTVIPGGGTLGAPSPAQLARLVDLIEELGIPAIFAENIDETALSRALADEVAQPVAVVVLATDSLGEPGTEEGTLVGMLRSNARKIVDALG
jgi:zinc/manganese transport system substrate-binding protein